MRHFQKHIEQNCYDSPDNLFSAFSVFSFTSSSSKPELQRSTMDIGSFVGGRSRAVPSATALPHARPQLKNQGENFISLSFLFQFGWILLEFSRRQTCFAKDIYLPGLHLIKSLDPTVEPRDATVPVPSYLQHRGEILPLITVSIA